VRRSSKVGFAIVSTFLAVVVALAALPVLAPVGENDLQRIGVAACGGAGLGGRADDGTPTILGPPSLTVADLSAWWRSTGRGQPPRLGLPVDDLIALYVSEGDVEGVRGDLAFAQAVHETGYLTSLDTTLNNFAGISHTDGALLGRPFADVAVGVRAHIQLLKKYAAGSGADLARPDVAPDAGARATTWGQLAGTWASDPDHWWRLSAVFESMLDVADPAGDTAAIRTQRCPDTRPDGIQTRTVRGITVHVAIAAQLDALLAAAERDGFHLTGSGYRSHERQIELRREHCGTSQYAIYEMPSSQCSPPTARPGGSMHEQGLAIDFSCDGALIESRSRPCFAWLADDAAYDGFYNLPSEPWHWSVNGS
jgi:hypothetical protein